MARDLSYPILNSDHAYFILNFENIKAIASISINASVFINIRFLLCLRNCKHYNLPSKWAAYDYEGFFCQCTVSIFMALLASKYLQGHISFVNTYKWGCLITMQHCRTNISVNLAKWMKLSITNGIIATHKTSSRVFQQVL